jgi:hypothetical protein
MSAASAAASASSLVRSGAGDDVGSAAIGRKTLAGLLFEVRVQPVPVRFAVADLTEAGAATRRSRVGFWVPQMSTNRW